MLIHFFHQKKSIDPFI